LTIKQALFLPFGAMVAEILIGLTVPGYSSVSQQLSALGLIPGYPAMSEHVVGIVVGASIIIFSVAIIRHPAGRFWFSALTSMLFGISMLFNGIFNMGSPLHGLYAIGLFTVLTPALFVIELHRSERAGMFCAASKWASFLTMLYFWATIVHFDPNGFHGLTQRLAIIPIFGWYSYASYTLLHSGIGSEVSTIAGTRADG
jgi:hypothetical membrane protein